MMLMPGAVAFGSAYFGVGVGTIYLDEVGCTGSENKLTECSRSSSVHCWGGHSKDAGVRCQGLGKWHKLCLLNLSSYLCSMCVVTHITYNSFVYSNCQWQLQLW